VFADSVRVNFSPTVDCKLIPQTTKNTLHPGEGWTMVVKLRRYLKTATFFVNEASAKPEINQGFIVEIELSIFGLYAIVEYRPAAHPLTANDPILLLDLNQEY